MGKIELVWFCGNQWGNIYLYGSGLPLPITQYMTYIE